MQTHYHRFLMVIVVVFGLMAVRSLAEVPLVANPAGKLGLAKPASQSNHQSNLGQSTAQPVPIQVAAVSADASIDDTSYSFSPESWWAVILVVLLASGVAILFRNMGTER